MADFSAKDVQALREQTGVGMMECKKALTEAAGDFEKAVLILRERGLAASQKKAGRIAAEGVIAVASEQNRAVLVEVNSETDFVAQNAEFLAFTDTIANTILKNKPADVEALKTVNLDGTTSTVEAALQEKILVIGENLTIRRFVEKEGAVACYLHTNKRVGTLVRFNADEATAAKLEFQEMGRDIAMQIAALSPKYTRKDEVPTAEIEAERKLLVEQVMEEGKPENIAQKMVEGRLNKFFFAQLCLEEQPFVKENGKTVKEYVNEVAKALGTSISIAEFVRYEVGEGLEKKVDNFADEVASMVK